MTSQPAAAAFRPDPTAVAGPVATCPSDGQPRPESGQALQRSSGMIDVAFERRDGGTQAVRAYQAGCGRLRFPRQHGGMDPTGVMINTAGGLTGGDRFDVRAALGSGTTATLTSQAAEKVYRSSGGSAVVENRISLSAGTRLDWLPQETILFDRSALQRGTHVEMAADATLTAIEMVVFGRAAMGETVTAGTLIDRWRIRRGGRLVLADTTRLDGAVSDALGQPPIAARATALALVVHVAVDAGRRLDPVRAALGAAPQVRAGASAWDGLLLARIVAPTGATLRAAVLPVLDCLRDGLPPPRTWMI